jgi:hypothetical protein
MSETTDTSNDAAAQTLAQRAWFKLEGVIERLQDFVTKMNTPSPAEPGMPVAREPAIGTDNSVRSTGRANLSNIKIEIGDRTLSILAMILATLVLGALVMLVFQLSSLIDAKIQAGSAKAEAEAHVARVDARYALAEVENMRTQLAARGITIPKANH